MRRSIFSMCDNERRIEIWRWQKDDVVSYFAFGSVLDGAWWVDRVDVRDVDGVRSWSS